MNKNDLFIIDPSYQVKFRHLAGVMASVEGHGWTVDDIRVMPRGRADSDSREGGMLIYLNSQDCTSIKYVFLNGSGSKKIFILRSFHDMSGFEAECIVTFGGMKLV